MSRVKSSVAEWLHLRCVPAVHRAQQMDVDWQIIRQFAYANVLSSRHGPNRKQSRKNQGGAT